VEEKPVQAPVVATTPTPPPVTGEQPKSAEPVEPQAKTPADWNQAPAAKTTVPAQAVETAVAVPPKDLFSVRNIAIVSVTFTLLVCALLLLSVRNARRATRASLITRSLDRERS
jgi:hypothetical protein